MSNHKVSQVLKVALADTYVLYLKTHGFHWNVEGRDFNTLHTMFEGQYNDMWMAVDQIAERIRALGEYAPGSYAQMIEVATITEATKVPDSTEMLEELVSGNEALVKSLKKAFEVSTEAGDDATADMMIERVQIHEKQIWMMRSMLK